jgi:hypothetical protein
MEPTITDNNFTADQLEILKGLGFVPQGDTVCNSENDKVSAIIQNFRNGRRLKNPKNWSMAYGYTSQGGRFKEYFFSFEKLIQELS